MLLARVSVASLGFSAWLLASFAGGASLAAAESFVRGDANASGRIEVTDAVRVLDLLFLEKPEAVRCQKAADTDDSGTLNVTDVLRILTYLFQRGPAPPAPFPFCGEDPTDDEIGCEEYGTCAPVHEVFGIEIQAGGVFFVIDRSGGQDNGELVLAEQETEKVILAFPEEIQFGVFFFDATLVSFPASGMPAQANPDLKASAAAFIQGMARGSGSCPQAGLFAALQMAARSDARQKVILYMTDGGGTCNREESQYLQATLEEVTSRNQGLARIYSLQMGTAGPMNTEYLRNLAAQNGGEYHLIPVR